MMLPRTIWEWAGAWMKISLYGAMRETWAVQLPGSDRLAWESGLYVPTRVGPLSSLIRRNPPLTTALRIVHGAIVSTPTAITSNGARSRHSQPRESRPVTASTATPTSTTTPFSRVTAVSPASIPAATSIGSPPWRRHRRTAQMAPSIKAVYSGSEITTLDTSTKGM